MDEIFAEIAAELRAFRDELRAAVEGAAERNSDQAAVDEAVASIEQAASAARHGLLRVRTMYNIKCSGCGVVMAEVHFNAWREVTPGTWSPYCEACRKRPLASLQ